MVKQVALGAGRPRTFMLFASALGFSPAVRYLALKFEGFTFHLDRTETALEDNSVVAWLYRHSETNTRLVVLNR